MILNQKKNINFVFHYIDRLIDVLISKLTSQHFLKDIDHNKRLETETKKSRFS